MSPSLLLRHAAALAVCLALFPSSIRAQNMPPAPVVLAPVSEGSIAPQAEFVGSLAFLEVAAVAAEVAGKAESVDFDDGDAVKKGQVLVGLNTELAVQDLAAKEASLNQARTQLEQLETEYRRLAALWKTRAISQQEYDTASFARRAQERRVATLVSELERIRLEIAKAKIRAPFDGVVLDRKADRGEWIAAGTVVAEVARADTMEVRVEAPEAVFLATREGQAVEVKAAGQTLRGVISARIPRGDVIHRTFPLRITVPGAPGLAESMQATVLLPTGPEEAALILPRDAVATVFGRTAVYVSDNATARMVPVQVLGYAGLNAGVRGEGLAAGAQVVVKGNERLQPGQPLAPIRQ